MPIGTHISVPNNTLFGQKLTAAVNDLDRALDSLIRLKAVADAYTAGGTQAANLENPAVAFTAGDGQTVYTDIANVVATINVPTITNMLARYLG
jgi:hypothetical protein